MIKSKKTALLYRGVLKGSGLALALSASLMCGCTGLGLGEEEFACNLEAGGTPCTSTWDVYEASNNGANPADTLASAGAAKRLVTGTDGTHGIPTANELQNGESDFVIDNYVTARLPDEPIPVRTPPQVMRIWVAPYEDTEGDFMVSGYVYTEIQPRRWTLGVSTEGTNSEIYQPLRKK